MLQARDDLLTIQVLFLSNPSQDLILRETSTANLLNEPLTAEESMLKQKSKIKWLTTCDQNTKYFRRVVTSNNSRSFITSSVTSDGRRIHDDYAIVTEILDFNKNLLGSRSCTGGDLHETFVFSSK